MDYAGTHTFDAPIDRVWAMFTDPAAHLAKFETMGHRDIEVVEHEVADDHMTLVVSRLVSLDLPGFAKKVLKPTNTVISTDMWERRDDGTYGGHFTVETPGAPIRSTGTTLLRAEDDGRTRYDVTVHLDVKVPIIGGKIADWARGDVERQMQMEFDAGDAWLASRA
jgi:hypothetical protein